MELRDQDQSQKGDAVAAAWASLSSGNTIEARRLIRRVLNFYPDDAPALLVLGVIQREEGAADTLRTLKRAVALAPYYPLARYYHGVALVEHGFVGLAMNEFRTCLMFAPDYQDALIAYGRELCRAGYYQKAYECFSSVTDLTQEVQYLKAKCCAHLHGRREEAEALFSACLSLNDDPRMHVDYAHFLLKQGSFSEAWRHYERRKEYQTSEIAYELDCEISLSPWRGDFTDGVLIIHGEASDKDDILFASYLPKLVERAKRARMQVVLICRPSLSRIFRASFPDIQVLYRAHGEHLSLSSLMSGQLNAHAWKVALGDLPMYIEAPAVGPYLVPDPEDLALISAELAWYSAIPLEFKIGIGWGCKSAAGYRYGRSSEVPPYLINGYAKQIHGAHFLNLQFGDEYAGLAELADLPIIDLGSMLTDYGKLAALISQLDCVISSSSLVANLSGALGIDTRVLLTVDHAWYWRSPISPYPRLRCYIQTIEGDWSGPLAKVFDDLEHQISARSRDEVRTGDLSVCVACN